MRPYLGRHRMCFTVRYFTFWPYPGLLLSGIELLNDVRKKKLLIQI